jgi:hypothetical protein
MILFVSGATVTMRRHQAVGELIVPAAGNAPDVLRLAPGRWAMDNGAYSGFDAALFVRMLERFHGRPGCRFVSAPDVVADAHATLQQWGFWSRLIRGVGFVPALVGQDGMTTGDVPWCEIGALFIGGTTEWKLGPQAEQLIAYAKARGLWVHMGRVNSQRRMWEAARKGIDSWDGSKYSRWGDRWIPVGLETADAIAQQPRLIS